MCVTEGRHWVSLCAYFRGQCEVRAPGNGNSSAGCEISFIAAYSLGFERAFCCVVHVCGFIGV